MDYSFGYGVGQGIPPVRLNVTPVTLRPTAQALDAQTRVFVPGQAVALGAVVIAW